MLVVTAACGCNGAGGHGNGREQPDSVSADINTPFPAPVVLDNRPVVPGAERILVWSDEFDATRLDPENWFAETGDGSPYGIPGWGNGELQWYLPSGAHTDNGLLILTARRERHGEFRYTSARINTRGRFAFRYGRIEARIRLPGGQGIWPAFWLMPSDGAYGPWPASGEIDIVEARNLGAGGGNRVVGSLHFGAEFPDNTSTAVEYAVPGTAAGAFHGYAVEWGPDEIRWYVDDVRYAVQDAWHTDSAAHPAPFDKPFYIILNVAVGGRFPGPPAATTRFPVTMQVDHVRVYSGGS